MVQRRQLRPGATARIPCVGMVAGGQPYTGTGWRSAGVKNRCAVFVRQALWQMK